MKSFLIIISYREKIFLLYRVPKDKFTNIK